MTGGPMDLRAVVGLVRRRFSLIAAVVLLGLTLASVAILTLRPVYTASALVMVDPSRKDLLDPDTARQASGSDSARVDSEVELVKAPATLAAVARSLDLAGDPEFGSAGGFGDVVIAALGLAATASQAAADPMQGVLERLGRAVSVQRKGLTYLISVDARSRDPRRAADIANALAAAYIHAQLDFKVSATLASRDIVAARLAEASQSLATSERAVDDYVDANAPAVAARTGRSDLADLDRRAAAADAAEASADARAGHLAASLQQAAWPAVAADLQSDEVSALAASRASLQHQLSGALAGSAEAVGLGTQLAAVDERLRTATQAQLEALRQQAATARSEAAALRAELGTTLLAGPVPAEVLTGLYELQQSAGIARAQYQTLLQRMKDLETQAFLQVADSRVVSEALAPARPSFPDPPLFLSLAGISALGLGIGLAALFENFVGGFVSEDQLQSLLRTGATAAIPRQRGGRPGAADGIGVADCLVEAPLSAFAEAIRRLRLTLDEAMHEQSSSSPAGGCVVMVTSPASGDGKTTIALALARAYALSGRATLLIDCDLRKPNLHAQLGLEPSTGLLEYLVNAHDAPPLTAIVARDDGSGAQVILGSHRSDVVTDQLLSGATFARLVRAARDSFDVVILDTPPVGPVVDGLYLAKQADAIAVVVRWASTSQQDVRAAVSGLERMRRQGTPIIAVLNATDARAYGRRSGYDPDA